nr:tyrosinase cofactor [Planosporangium thailandense]
MKLAATGVVAVTGVAGGTQLVTATRSQAAPQDHNHSTADETFEEVYRGRRIECGVSGASHHHDRRTALGVPLAAAPFVRIDEAELHVMVNADGSYTSVVNHYKSFRTLTDVARAAVDDLNGAQLLPIRA